MYFAARSFARTLLIAGALAGMALAATPSGAQPGPPSGLARLTRLNNGQVSVQPNGLDQWALAQNNMPIDPGDRISADPTARGELDAGPVRVYFGNGADVSLVSLDQNGIQVGVAAGSVNVATDGFPQGQSLSVQTPNGAVTLSGQGLFLVSVYPDQQSTIITDSTHSVIYLNGGGGFNMPLGTSQSIQLIGTNPVYAQPLQPAPYDEFDRWSGGVEVHRINCVSARYVSVEMPGYEELDEAGDWQPQSDYGPIWFPHVEGGWAPYHNGHWVSRPFYGWTWVADEPWGVAPFHYGRWVQVQGRWGWIPGPREGHPIWSPAQVVFAGGIQIGGVGVSVWFPLGPGEPYHPWYPASPQYINQINITNIHESKIVHVQNVYNVTNITNITYVNKTVGVTAMNQNDFASGRPAQAAAVKVNAQQIEHVQAAAPAAKPPAQPVILHPVAKPAAVAAARPVLINNKGQQAAAVPNAKPVAVPVKATPPTAKPIPGHAAMGAPMVGGKPAPAAAKAPEPPAPAKAPAAAPTKAPEATKMTPVAPKVVQPTAKPAEAKPVPTAKTPPAPAEKPQPMAQKPVPAKEAPATKPEAKPATPVAKPATQAARPAEPKPAETKPIETKPAPNSKEAKKAADDKKAADEKKKEEKKNPAEKPE